MAKNSKHVFQRASPIKVKAITDWFKANGFKPGEIAQTCGVSLNTIGRAFRAYDDTTQVTYRAMLSVKQELEGKSAGDAVIVALVPGEHRDAAERLLKSIDGARIATAD